MDKNLTNTSSVVQTLFVKVPIIIVRNYEYVQYPEVDIFANRSHSNYIYNLLVDGINKNLVDVIVSDHKPEDEEQKRLTFSQAATGASGIETLLPLALELFHNGSVKLNLIIKLFTKYSEKILYLKTS